MPRTPVLSGRCGKFSLQDRAARATASAVSRFAPLLSCLALLLACAGCQSTKPHHDSENYRRLDQTYLNEVIAENQFDPDFAAHSRGEFYPVPYLANADQHSAEFWQLYLYCREQHGAKDAAARLRKILSEHGLCMFIASTTAQQHFSEVELAQTFANPPGPPTRLMQYLYGNPAGSFFLRNSTSFLEQRPGS